jgi:hypothetical protein
VPPLAVVTKNRLCRVAALSGGGWMVRERAVAIVDPTRGRVVAEAVVIDGVAVARLGPDQPATYAVVVSSRTGVGAPYTVWTVLGTYR